MPRCRSRSLSRRLNPELYGTLVVVRTTATPLRERYFNSDIALVIRFACNNQCNWKLAYFRLQHPVMFTHLSDPRLEVAFDFPNAKDSRVRSARGLAA